MRAGFTLPAIILVAPFVLSGCDQDDGVAQTERANKDVLQYFQDHKVGVSDNYAVFKTGLTGTTEPTAIVFGFVDNAAACTDIANRLNSDEPNAYHCELVSQQH